MMNDTYRVNDKINIKYLSHSGFVITAGSEEIVIDPYLSGNQLAKVKWQDIKATDIILTHGHSDHVGDAVSIASKTGAIIITVFELAEWCRSKGVEAQGMPVGGTFRFSWGKVHLRAAMHSNSTPDGDNAGVPVSVLLDIGGYKIYHLGDTALIDDFKLVGEIYKPDLVMVPIGGYYTMDMNEAVTAVKWLNVPKVIPMHYNTFPNIKVNPAAFKEKVEATTSAECIVLGDF